ncbi:unnamed protein product [Rhizophagus irregularis]|nr:unnamed protein product [Rhizophagus irregularis]
MSTQKHKRQLLTPGDIVRNLHYGPFAVNWWFFTGIKTKTAKVKQIAIPIRVNMRIKFELNQTEVIIRVVDNNWKHGYVCELDMEAIIYSTPSAAINETYKKKINVKTRFSGPVSVITLGTSDQAELNFAGPGYRSSFIINIIDNTLRYAQTLPHIGGWSRFSPTDITKLIEEPLHKPTPNVSTHTKPNSIWNFSLIRTEDKSNVAIFENTNHLERQNEKSPLESGWTLKSSHKYGQRGTGKRISMTVKAYLEGQRRILRSGIGKIINYLYNISFVESRENFSLNCAEYYGDHDYFIKELP